MLLEVTFMAVGEPDKAKMHRRDGELLMVHAFGAQFGVKVFIAPRNNHQQRDVIIITMIIIVVVIMVAQHMPNQSIYFLQDSPL